MNDNVIIKCGYLVLVKFIYCSKRHTSNDYRFYIMKLKLIVFTFKITKMSPLNRKKKEERKRKNTLKADFNNVWLIYNKH